MTREVCRTFTDLKCTKECVDNELQQLNKIVDKLVPQLDNVKLAFLKKLEVSKYKLYNRRSEAMQEFCRCVNSTHEGCTLNCQDYTGMLGKYDFNVELMNRQFTEKAFLVAPTHSRSDIIRGLGRPSGRRNRRHTNEKSNNSSTM